MTISTEDLSRLEVAELLVGKQAEDASLWFNAKYVSEAYLQNALRNLHKAVEGHLSKKEVLGIDSD